MLILQPLQSEWVIEFWNYLTSLEGYQAIAIRSKTANVTDTIERRSQNFKNLDPFVALKPPMKYFDYLKCYIKIAVAVLSI